MINIKKYGMYFDNSFDGVLIFDVNGHLQYKNKVANGILRNNEAKNFNEVMSALQCDTKFADIKHGSISNGSYYCINKEVRVNYTYVTEEQIYIMQINHIANVLGMNLSEEAADAFLVFDEDLKIIYANRAACTMLELSRTDLLNKPYTDIFDDEHDRLHPKTNKIKIGTPLVVERKLKTNSGKIIHVELHTKLFESNHYFTIIRNIDLRNKYKNELEQKNAELEEINKQLEESQRNSKYLFESFPIGVLIAKEDGSISEVNDKMRIMLGSKSKKATKTLNVLDTLKERNMEFYRDIQLSLSGGVRIDKFYNYQSIWGKNIYAKTMLVPFNAKNENMVMIIIQDYTLLDKQEKLIGIFSQGLANASSGIIVTDLKGVVSFSNDKASEFMGYSKDELIGKSLQEMGYHKYNEETFTDLVTTIRREESWRGELKTYKKDGSLSWMHINILHIKDKHGIVSNLMIIQDDITEKKDFEERLKLKTQQLSTLVDNIPDIILLKNEKDEWLMTNSTTLKHLGIPDDVDYKGKTSFELSNICKRNKEALRLAFTTDKVVWKQNRNEEFETTLTNEQGEEMIVNITKYPLYHSNGRKKGLVTIGKNITEHKRYIEQINIAKENAIKADKLKSSFLANMSHEIKTPLSVMHGFLDLLSKYDLKKEQIKRYHAHIKESSEQLTGTIDDMILYAELQVNKIEVEKNKFDIVEVLDKLKTKFDAHISINEKTHLELSIQNEPYMNKLIIDTDKKKVFNIFSRLLDNAVKFTEEGQITFGFNMDKNKNITFYVKDTGIGIEEKYKHIIFDQFRQVDETTTRKYEGKGLGLTISKDLTTLLGGTIWLESTVDEGSTFYFTLPVKPINN